MRVYTQTGAEHYNLVEIFHAEMHSYTDLRETKRESCTCIHPPPTHSHRDIHAERERERESYTWYKIVFKYMCTNMTHTFTSESHLFVKLYRTYVPLQGMKFVNIAAVDQVIKH